MMKNLKFFLVLSILNILALFAYSFTLPQTIPIHFNLYGVADRYASRWTSLLFGLIPIVLITAMMIYRHYTRDNEKYQKNRRAENIVFNTISTFLIILTWLPIFTSSSTDSGVASFSFPLIIGVPLGILMIVLGNVMSIIKPNRFLGVRTPWTLKNELVWHKTHRKDAYVTILAGLIMIIGSLIAHFAEIPIIGMISLLVAILLLVVFPILYSYILYKKITSDENIK